MSSSEDEEPTFREIMSSFAERTTMHGLGRVGASRRLVRAIWLILVLVFAGWAVYSVGLIVMTFMSYPVSTIVSVKFDDNIQFPAVTVCNLNNLRISQFQNNEKLKALQEAIKAQFNETYSPRDQNPAGNINNDNTTSTNNTNTTTTNTNAHTAYATNNNNNDNVGPAPSFLLDGSMTANANSPSRTYWTSWSSWSSNGGGFNNGDWGVPSAAKTTIPPPNTTNPWWTSGTRRTKWWYSSAPYKTTPFGVLRNPPATTTSTTTTTATTTTTTTTVAPTPPSKTLPPQTAPPQTTSSTVTPPTAPPPTTTTPQTTTPTVTPTTTTPLQTMSSTVTTSTSTSTMTPNPEEYVYPVYDDMDDYREQMEETPNYQAEMRNKIVTYLDQIPVAQRVIFSHQLSEMLMDCRYHKKETCYRRNFTLFYNNNFGNCYTFNKEVIAEAVSKPGPAHGLSLILNVQTSEYMPQSQRVGFKVMVHDQNRMPFPEDEGVVVSPGFATSIAVTKRDIKRSPPPYGDCRSYGEEDNLKNNMYAMPPYKVGYSDKACQVTCYQREVMKSCGCCDIDFPCKERSPSLPGNINVHFCTEEKDARCQQQVSEDFETGVLACQDQCRPACEETIFAEEVSMGVWPSMASLGEIQLMLSKLPEKMQKNLNISDVNFLRTNMARIDVFYKHLNYERIETEPTYNWYRLLSDVGGQIGLWLGFSLLTAMELLELVLILIRHGIRVLHNTGNNLGKAVFANNQSHDNKKAAAV